MSSTDDDADVESGDILTPKDGQQIKGAVGDEIYRQALRRIIDTNRTSSSEGAVGGVSMPTSQPVKVRGGQAVAIGREGGGEVPTTCVEGSVAETSERHGPVIMLTIGGMRLPYVEIFRQGRSEGSSQAQAIDGHSVINRGAVRDEIHGQALRRSIDTNRVSSPEGAVGEISMPSSQPVEWRRVGQEGGGEVLVTSVGGSVTETREERHASVTVGGMRLSDVGTLDQCEGNSQALAIDKRPVIFKGDLHLHQTVTNVKIENSQAVLVGDNPTVSSGVVQEAQTPEAQVRPTQEQVQLKALRDFAKVLDKTPDIRSCVL